MQKSAKHISRIVAGISILILSAFSVLMLLVLGVSPSNNMFDYLAAVTFPAAAILCVMHVFNGKYTVSWVILSLVSFVFYFSSGYLNQYNEKQWCKEYIINECMQPNGAINCPNKTYRCEQVVSEPYRIRF